MLRGEGWNLAFVVGKLWSLGGSLLVDGCGIALVDGAYSVQGKLGLMEVARQQGRVLTGGLVVL